MTTEKNLKENRGYEEYRQHPAIANSDLKYLHSPRLFKLNKEKKIDEEDTEYFGFGTLVDNYILSQETFDDKYFLMPDIETPGSPKQTAFVESIIDGFTPVEAYCANYADKGEAKNAEEAKKLLEKLKPYLELQETLKTKTPYTQTEWDKLNTIVQNARANKQIDKLLFNPEFGTITFSHLQITGVELFGIQWKGELDRVVVDTVNKEIYNIDLKTSSSTIDGFKWSYKKYYYYRQQALYRELLKAELIKRGIIDADDIDNYIIKTRCIMLQSSYLNEAFCIPVPEDILQKGLEELKEAAEKIKFYDTHGWDYTVSYHKNNGLEVLEWGEVFE